MKMNIKATNTELTPAIEEYVDKRVQSLGKVVQLEDPSVNIRVEVGKTTEHHKTGNVFRAEFYVTTRGREYYAEAVATDLYAAIDEVRDDIFRQIEKKRGRMRDLFHRGARSLKKRLKGLKPWGEGEQ